MEIRLLNSVWGSKFNCEKYRSYGEKVWAIMAGRTDSDVKKWWLILFIKCLIWAMSFSECSIELYYVPFTITSWSLQMRKLRHKESCSLGHMLRRGQDSKPSSRAELLTIEDAMCRSRINQHFQVPWYTWVPPSVDRIVLLHPHSEKVRELCGGGGYPNPGIPMIYSEVSHDFISALATPCSLWSLITGRPGEEVSTCRKWLDGGFLGPQDWGLCLLLFPFFDSMVG